MPRQFDKQGFTLIEVIVGIILAALLGTMIVQYTGTNLQATVESLVATKNNAEAISVMEEITRDYRNWLENNPDATIPEFKQDLTDDNADDDYYYPDIQTKIVKLRQTEDPDNSILRVTVIEGDRELVSLFTK